MSGIVGSKFNHRGSGLIGSYGTDGQHMLSSGAGQKHVFETVTAATYDDELIKADITALALREATNESSAAFNLPNQFIDTFTDDTNLATQTDVDRDSGFISTGGTTATEYDYDGASTGHNLVYWAGMVNNNSTWREIDADGDAGLANTNSFIPSVGIANNSYATFAQSTGDGVYYLFDYGISRSFGGKLKIGKHTPTGNVSQWKLLHSTDNVSYSAWDMSGISQEGSTVYASGGGSSGGGVTGGTSAGVITLADYTAGEYTIVNTVTGVPTITARYIKMIVNAMGAGNNNSGHGPFAPYTISASTNATGTLIQSANTVASAKTEVAGVFFYKDNEGTASIGTDLKIYFSCNNGGAWTEAASYNAITPLYATGIKQVRLGETTCTSGTGIIYKAVWANQSNGSKETQLHGIGINY